MQKEIAIHKLDGSIMNELQIIGDTLSSSISLWGLLVSFFGKKKGFCISVLNKMCISFYQLSNCQFYKSVEIFFIKVSFAISLLKSDIILCISHNKYTTFREFVVSFSLFGHRSM